MRTLVLVSVSCVFIGLLSCPLRVDGQANPTADMDATARAFLKAYHDKDVDALMASADAPFLVGTVLDPKILKTGADVRGELQARLGAGENLAGQVAKTLTWAKAILPKSGTRERMKPAIDITGESGGYAALANAKGRSLEVSSTSLLVGMRYGKAKVVGILDARKRR
jgi:hypothetical protein